MKIRLNKFIATHSKYSRRKADELINSGRIKVNNQKTTIMGTVIDSIEDTVHVDNKKISIVKEKIYIAFNKPEGYVTTRKDELNRQTIMDLLPKISNLKPVGRLDKNTEGLILLSNDGDFINRHTHPKFECEKEYFVKIKGQLSNEKIEKLKTGIKIDQKITATAKIKILKKSLKESTLTIIIHEGRNRQIRKMFASIKHPVKYLRRIRIGNIQLRNLELGEYRHLTNKEINGKQFS
ncbi:pseudouridine synthase [Patescibacteria group bacterium]